MEPGPECIERGSIKKKTAPFYEVGLYWNLEAIEGRGGGGGPYLSHPSPPHPLCSLLLSLLHLFMHFGTKCHSIKIQT